MTTLPRNADGWENLDAELGRWLRVRPAARTARTRETSSIEAIAHDIRRVRKTLAFVASRLDAHDARTCALVMRTYRWSIRVARELESIGLHQLDAIAEWSRLEAFAPFALAFHESVIARPFADAPKSPELARLSRDVDAVLAPLMTAMTSSALAA